MLLEVLLVLLLVGATGATLLTFFIRGDEGQERSSGEPVMDSDNPQRDI